MATSLAAARAWFIVVTLTAVGAAAAAGYGLTAPKRYDATAQILVTPVSASDPTFAGLDVLRDASGRQTAAQNAAILVRSPQVADAVRAQLGVRRSSASLLGGLHTRVEPKSDVVDVTVEDTSSAVAAQISNAFVDALIAQRTASFQSQLSSAIHRDQQLLAGGSTGPQAVELGRRLAELRSFQGQPDPTLRRGSTATAPTSSSWPNLAELIATGAGAGLAAGALIVLGLLLLRRTRAYDPLVSGPRPDRSAEVLADRLERRLAARESALAARERDLQAKIEELRALDPETLAERERQLQERVETVTRRELEIARRASAPAAEADTSMLAAREAALSAHARELEERETALAARERALEERGRRSEAEAAAALDERERQLEERVAVVQRREVELARRAAGQAKIDEAGADLAERERALAEREAALVERAKHLEVQSAQLAADQHLPAEPPSARAAAAPAPVASAPATNGAFNLGELERLVEERGPHFPGRLEEWRSYLFFLRDYAEPDGSLPGSFDWLVHDTFREILS